MKEPEKKMELPKITLDDLFNDSGEAVLKIRLKEIDPFPNHPYKVIDDDKMMEMVESIKEYGVTQPVIVRRKENGRYEMISGHRRKRASELAGEEYIKAIVKDLTDEEATILMVDTNESQRDEFLPSEKAFAYKMKLDAMKKQGKRTDLEVDETSLPMETKLRTDKKIGKENGESGTQVFRYVRLTSLIPEVLEMVDNKKIAFRPAVEISYLSEDNQYVLYEIMDRNDATPSLAQAIYMKKLEQEGKLDTDKIENIMNEEKPNQIEKIKLDAKKFDKLFPKNVTTNSQKEDFIIMCIEEHNKRLRNRELTL